MICHNCNKQVIVDAGIKVGFHEECPHCASYLHCCLNCTFYDKTRANKCFESQAEFVSDKEKGNYCEYFEPTDREISNKQENEKSKARNKFDALFGD